MERPRRNGRKLSSQHREDGGSSAGRDHEIPSRPAASADVVQGEIRDFVRAHELRRRQLPRAIVVGVLAGSVAVAFTRVLVVADDARTALIARAHAFGLWGFPLPVLVAVVGGAVAVLLVRKLAPETSGSGIPHLKAVLHLLQSLRGLRVVAVKFAGGVVGIGSGLALGREGPTIQMGGALGQIASRWFRCTEREHQTLIAAGAGAGLAAAFNAPLAGLVFVLEEVQRDFSPTVFTATLVAAVTSDVVTRLLVGQLPIFHVRIDTIPPLQALPVSLLVGVAAGVLGVAFNRGLLASLDAFQRMGTRPVWLTGATAGCFVGVVGWFVPEALGGGHRLVEQTLGGTLSLPALAGFFVLRFCLTMASYGCGAPGGIFAPLLVLGSEIGLGVGLLAQRLVPAQADLPAMFAVVGMAAYFTAIVRAPLTGIVLIVEMTGNYSLVLPLLAACLTAYGVADFLKDRPVYEALLERDLLRGTPTPTLESPLLLELTVAPASPFEGKRVRELGLPAGCVIITVLRGVREYIPSADFRFEAGDRLTAVVDPEAAEAALLLRSGTNCA